MLETTQKKPYLALLVSIVALSQAAILVKLANASPEVLGFWRVVFTCIIVIVLMVIKKERPTLSFLKLNFKHVFFAGALFCLHFWLWFHGVQKTTIANAVVIFNLNPIFIAIGAKFFHKEQLSPKLLLALVLGLTGVLVIKWNSLSLESAGTIGDLLVFMGCIAFSIYVIFAKTLRETGSNLTLTLYFNLICFFGFGAGVLATGDSFFDHGLQSWLSFIGLAAIPSILGHSLFTYCLKHIKATVASCSKLLEPVIASIVAALLFSEPILLNVVLGFAVIAIGLLNLYLRE